MIAKSITLGKLFMDTTDFLAGILELASTFLDNKPHDIAKYTGMPEDKVKDLQAEMGKSWKRINRGDFDTWETEAKRLQQP